MYTIMVVDDKEIFRRKLKRLRCFSDQNNFKITFEAQNGKKALELLQSEQIDIVITDIRMPIMDGMELLKEIKNNALCGCIGLLSEYPSFAYAQEGLKYGAFDYIIKPIDEEKMTDFLTRAKQYLDKLKQNEAHNYGEFRIWQNLVINGDPAADEIAERLLDKIYQQENRDLMETHAKFEKVMEFLMQRIKETKPYMEYYLNIPLLCNIDNEKYDDYDVMKHNIKKRVKAITEGMKLFSTQGKSELMKNVCVFVLNHIEDGLTLQVVADHHFVNKTYLSHIFKREMEMSFIDFLTLAKIARSKILLAETEYKVYEVANILGYEDTEYFSKLFKKYMGQNPNAYKRLMNGIRSIKNIDSGAERGIR